ncbi:MAG: Gfo/Idh/MocA family oxidoreductase [Ruminococcaceae bacterium]|nr:Gfo/Idh/MocA family oxidoreductase [Oscillospiraceae bacterium]
MEKKVKIGVFGAGRGKSMIKYCKNAPNAELVAICDWYVPQLEKRREESGEGIAFYTDFDEFLKHDMDAVVLSNYANEHAPYAIKAMKAGKHVISEVLPFCNMKQGVELIEAIEETGMIYSYAENYCYMPAPHEIRRLFRDGTLGEFEYGEGEYMHDCESIWPGCTYGRADHWRNQMSATFYCTHSIGPLIHIAGMRPVKVCGFEGTYSPKMQRMGAYAGHMAMIVITLENGAILKSIHGVGPSRNSVWYSCYGSKGRAESAREDAVEGNDYQGVQKLYLNADGVEGDNGTNVKAYEPKDALAENAVGFSHGGGDWFTMYNFCEKILGREAEIIDIYEACDMFLPGLIAYESILAGGVTMDVPDFRDKAQREIWRNNTACTFPEFAGDMLQPIYSKGNPVVPDEIREEQLKKFNEDRKYKY